jgi:predicted ATPase
MILGLNLQITKGYAALEVNQAYTRARELAEQMIEGPQLGPVYWGIQVYYTVKGDLRRGRALAEQLLGLAQTGNDQTLLLLGHSAMGVTSLYLGELHAARAHLETVQQYRSHSFTHAHDPVLGSLSYAAVALWALGYPDQALRQSLEVLSLAEELGHPHTLVSGLGFASVVYLCRGEGQAARDRAEAALTISTEHGFSFWWTWALIFRGSALAKQGSRAEGIAQMRQGVAGWQATGAKIAWGYQATLLAEALGKEGQPEDGLTVLAEALAVTRGTGERHWQAELYRLKGELLLMHAGVRDGWPATPAGIGLRPEAEQSVLTEAEGCYRQALDVARRQNAKSFELRAVISLSRLYEKQGKKDEARQMLGDIYGWFTEGFDTEDLNEARLLLHELA